MRNTMGIMLSIGLAVLMAGVVMADEKLPNQLTEKEKQDGWVLLFDGKSMDNFRNYNKDKVSDGWKVVDGAITRVGKAGDLITRDQYGAFEFSLQYKISEAGNSGIMFHVVETDKPPYFTGPECQIQDNVKGHDPQKSGWLYQMYPSKVDATKPVGEWNELRIVITPEKCEHYMNGTKYCEYVLGSDDWNERLAKSKFASWEGFGTAGKGYICLQDHGNEVAFRNIKVRPLDKKDAK